MAVVAARIDPSLRDGGTRPPPASVVDGPPLLVRLAVDAVEPRRLLFGADDVAVWRERHGCIGVAPRLKLPQDALLGDADAVDRAVKGADEQFVAVDGNRALCAAGAGRAAMSAEVEAPEEFARRRVEDAEEAGLSCAVEPPLVHDG